MFTHEIVMFWRLDSEFATSWRPDRLSGNGRLDLQVYIKRLSVSQKTLLTLTESLDCRDHKCSEKKHPRFNLDRAYSSKKHGGHAALKYELGVSLFHDQIVWIGKPCRASKADITIFREGGLKRKFLEIFPGKYIIVDLGYRSSEEDEKMLAYPNLLDLIPLKKFKSLARCRQEDVNARMSKFKVLNYEFEHSVEKHEICFTCVSVMLQYQLNCGDAYLTKL